MRARTVINGIARPPVAPSPAAKAGGPRRSFHYKSVSRPKQCLGNQLDMGCFSCELPQRGGHLANDSSDNKRCAFALRLAAPISSSYTCIKGHEQEATNKFQAFAVGAVAKFFNDRGIDVNQPTMQVSVNLTTVAGDGAPYVAFTGTGSSTTEPSGTVAGTVAAKDGSKFNVLSVPDRTHKTAPSIES
jgi:hypothetical protein